MSDTSDKSHLVCAVWGPLRHGRVVHMDCPVIVREPLEGIAGSAARTGPLPMVCGCECQTCKRAWWARGRPVLKDGAIVFDK